MRYISNLGPFATSAPGGGVLGLVTSSLSSKQEMKTTNQTNTMRMGDQQQSSISILPSMGADQSMKHQMLSREEWFHGPISRKDAEQLLIDVRWILFHLTSQCFFRLELKGVILTLTYLLSIRIKEAF